MKYMYMRNNEFISHLEKITDNYGIDFDSFQETVII